jgi:benzoyl-CoA 2,3-dioxygenase component A
MGGSEQQSAGGELARQHVIDPEICIRCNTCEATCPIGAITHDDRNYVVRFDVCNGCNACVPPCPTGAIDNWRTVVRSQAHSIEAQLGWDALPAQEPLQSSEGDGEPDEVRRLIEEAHAGVGGAVRAPASAAQPSLNLYGVAQPLLAKVSGNFRLTEAGATSDVRHIVLDFGSAVFPVLEGQTIGVLPPGTDAQGKPHHLRLYSVASPREGERPGYNNVALTVKRVTEDHDGQPVNGIASNYLCDLKVGDTVRIAGPYGNSFLMPNHPGASLLMVCTGTGSAPMRAMTERRRRRMALKEGGELMLFFGARAPGELPYFGPLTRLPPEFIDINMAFSRHVGHPRCYVQDLIRQKGEKTVRLLKDPDCYVYICGLKAMENGVLEAFADACRAAGEDWPTVHASLLAGNRLHIETY